MQESYIEACELDRRCEAVAMLPGMDKVENLVAALTGTDAAPVSYRLAYRNEADSLSVPADSNGRSTYEKSNATLAQLVEQRFCKP